VILPESVQAADLVQAVGDAGGAALRETTIFDVYRGKGIEAGLKSVAMSLILQDSSRTLTDEDTEAIMSRVLGALKERFGAVLRN
jgi:phenylalanyl-tRNA synthetase beta chain